LNGVLIRKSLDVRNWDAAQKIIRSWESDGMREVITVAQTQERFIADQESRGLSVETIAKSRLLLTELADYFGSKNLSNITSDDLSRFRETWKVQPSTARKKLERLRSFFKFCVGRKWISDNPASALRPPKEVSIEKKPYEKAELERIAWAIPLFPRNGIYGEANCERIRAFVAVLRWTGLRIRDVVQLQKSAIRGDFIVLRTHKNQKPIKLPLHPEIKEALAEVGNGSEYFFWSGLGNPKSCVGDWQRTFRRLSAIAGVHIHAHRWRHTFATDLLSKGVPVSEVAAILGNSTRIVEKHYAQWIQSRQDALEKAVKATWS
jgi:integrase